MFAQKEDSIAYGEDRTGRTNKSVTFKRSKYKNRSPLQISKSQETLRELVSRERKAGRLPRLSIIKNSNQIQLEKVFKQSSPLKRVMSQIDDIRQVKQRANIVDTEDAEKIVSNMTLDQKALQIMLQTENRRNETLKSVILKDKRPIDITSKS